MLWIFQRSIKGYTELVANGANISIENLVTRGASEVLESELFCHFRIHRKVRADFFVFIDENKPKGHTLKGTTHLHELSLYDFRVSQNFILRGAIHSFVADSCQRHLFNKLNHAKWRTAPDSYVFRQPGLDPKYRARSFKVNGFSYHIECSKAENVLSVLNLNAYRQDMARYYAWNAIWEGIIRSHMTYYFHGQCIKQDVPTPNSLGLEDQVYAAKTDEDIKDLIQKSRTADFDEDFRRKIKSSVRDWVERNMIDSLQHLEMNDIQTILDEMLIDSVMNA